MRKQVPSLLCLLSLVTLAQAHEAPKIVREDNGKVTHYRIEGALAPTTPLTCIPLVQAKSTFTPPDLYKGVLDCLAKDHYDSAAALFALAGAYARFDAERVSDKTARQARTVLLMNTLAGAAPEKKERLSAALRRATDSQEARDTLCSQVRLIGMPNYYPAYMILHGAKAFRGNPHEGAIATDFNAATVWISVLTAALQCPSS